MSNMSEFLADIYGTNQESASNYDYEVEKLAQAELLDGLLQKEAGDGTGIADLSDYELYKVASEVFGEDSVLVREIIKAASEEEDEDEDEEEEDEEKTAHDLEMQKMAQNADTAGRIMAHAMWQELGAIKEASVKSRVVGAAKSGYGAAKSGYGAVRDAIKGSPDRYREAGRMAREAVTGKGSVGDGVMSKMDRLRAAGGAAKKVAPELAGAGILATGGGYAATRGRGNEKQAHGGSLLDTLAAARLEEHMLLKQASAGGSFQDAVTQRAYELAHHYGIDV